jgi:signal transduction histidine kinase
VTSTGEAELEQPHNGFSSSISVPLPARGRVLGALTFVADAGRRYDARDLAVAEELGRRTAVAIDNARLYREVERRAQAAQALAFVGDGVVLVDQDAVIRLWNPAAAQITGLAEDEVVGRSAVDAIPGWESLAPRVPARPRPETLPVEIGTRELWLSILGVAFEGGTVYAFRDLTEERALEKLKSDFVATISHELRTPLAAIYGAALTLRRGDFELEGHQRETLLDVVAAEADRLARIVNDVLWASRLESETMHITIESCDGATLVRDIVDAAATYAPPNIDVGIVDPGGVPPVAADPEKVRQVLRNLLDNAIKYSPDGGEIRLCLEHHDHRIRFLVRDQGLGIPPHERERVFEKFYRLDPNLTRGVGGTGLGLYICRELVRRMGGSIWVEPNGPRGSTFIVELPEGQ